MNDRFLNVKLKGMKDKLHSSNVSQLWNKLLFKENEELLAIPYYVDKHNIV